MKKLTCEMCGSTELMKQDGVFVCQTCGCQYSVEEAKRMMVEGTVDVQGTVKVDNTDFVQRYLANARRAKEKEDWGEANKYYNMVEQNEPTNIEAIFYSTFAQIKQSLLETDTKEKRQGIFNTLVKVVSIIDDNYDCKNKDHQKLLYQIMDDINGLKEGTIVPTTHRADYVTKNGYGSVVDRNQIIEDDDIEITYDMIYQVFEAYMDSLLNIYTAHSENAVKELILDNINGLKINSEIHERLKKILDAYTTPRELAAKVASKLEIPDDYNNPYNPNHYQNSFTDYEFNNIAKGTIQEVAPQYSNGLYYGQFRALVKEETKKLYPNLQVKSGGCYVATCVYGSYDCPEVWTLRRYRDYTLAETWYGRAFIHTYYAISPTIVKWFGHNDWFKNMWRGKLDRMVSDLLSQGVKDTPYEDRKW